MQEFVTPDTLDELDRRVYDLAIQHIPLAEMAVRLGVPVPQADEKLQRLYSRLGVTSRDALRALSERPSQPQTTATSDESVIGGETEPVGGAEPDSAEPTPRFTRRAILAGGAIASVIGLSGIAALVMDRRRADAPETMTPADEPTPTVAGALSPIARVSFGETWEVADFAKGDLIDWAHGLFLMGIVGGSVRAHRLRVPDGINYQTWPGGRFVSGSAAKRDSPTEEFLMDILNTEIAWSWSPEDIRLIGVAGKLADATLFFEHVDNNKGTGELSAFRVPSPGADLEPAFELTVPPTGFETPLLVSPDGDAVAVVSLDSPTLKVTVISAKSGEIRATHVAGVTASGFALDALQNLDGGDAFLLGWHLFEPQTGKWLTGFSSRFAWDGGGAPKPLFSEKAATWSTDGSLYLREISLRSATSGGADGPREYWPALEIVEAETGKVLQRIRSAAIYYGDWSPSPRWTDPTSFVALVRSETERDGFDVAHFVQSPKRPGWEILQRLPFPSDPTLEGAWFQAPWVQGVVPAPGNPELVAFGKFAALNLRDGQLSKANIRSESGPSHIDPWAAGPNWLTFAFPHGGHGGATPPVLLQPKFESGEEPVDPVQRFVVARTGDGLNVRSGPGIDSTRIVGVVPDGTALEIAEDVKFEPGLRSVQHEPDGIWVHVKTGDDLYGWVSATYLDWA